MMAYDATIATWKIVNSIEDRIAGKQELQKLTGQNMRAAIQLCRSEIAIYQHVIKEAEMQLEQLSRL